MNFFSPSSPFPQPFPSPSSLFSLSPTLQGNIHFPSFKILSLQKVTFTCYYDDVILTLLDSETLNIYYMLGSVITTEGPKMNDPISVLKKLSIREENMCTSSYMTT